jgi:hypothetical protein
VRPVSHFAGCTLVLDRPIWFKREGELVLNLFQGDLRVASLAFTLQRTAAGLCLFIGAVQGIHKGIDSERSLAIYRDLTKDFEGLRPRSLLLEALKCLARAVGADGLYAVGDAYRHHRHPYFGAEKSQDLAANYDAIWLEHGAPSEREDFFSLPLAAAQRAAEDIAPKKRAMYRRRQALLEALFAQLEAALAASAGPAAGTSATAGLCPGAAGGQCADSPHSWLAKAAGVVPSGPARTPGGSAFCGVYTQGRAVSDPEKGLAGAVAPWPGAALETTRRAASRPAPGRPWRGGQPRCSPGTSC